MSSSAASGAAQGALHCRRTLRSPTASAHRWENCVGDRSSNQRLDRWADWLLHGRQRGFSKRQTRRLAGELRRVRDRVLRGARLRRGHRVLDVGAGTGLLALEARRRVGASGYAVALDISRDALAECGRQATSDGPCAPLDLVAGDVLLLPFRDECFDAVLTRSVLIYVGDKVGAVRELHRVLRAGRRASIFEPINSASAVHDWNWGLDLSPIQPAHDRVVAHLREHWEHRDTMMGFDERDLTRMFIEAGFKSVHLSYEHDFKRASSRASEVASSLRSRPNPTMLSYEEAARAVLKDSADQHLSRLLQLLTSQPLSAVGAVAYVTATG
jgi:ubiquinone/menaquinone biosynthesis C-methylase UbiE